VYQYPDVESYPIFLQLLLSHGHLFFNEYFTVNLHGLIKLSLQNFKILLFRVFFGFQVFSILRGSSMGLRIIGVLNFSYMSALNFIHEFNNQYFVESSTNSTNHYIFIE
jgi:hypothetical protein